jgi:hypothetical protein
MFDENEPSSELTIFDPDRLVGTNPLVSMPVEDMTPEQRASAYAILKYLEKLIETRLKAIRGPLLADAEKAGSPVLLNGKPTGSLRLNLGAATAVAKNSGVKEPNEKGMAELLLRKGISIDKAYDETKKFIYNPSKVEKLIDTGHLKAEEVEDLKRAAHVLVVEPSDELTEWLDNRIQRSALGFPR